MIATDLFFDSFHPISHREYFFLYFPLFYHFPVIDYASLNRFVFRRKSKVFRGKKKIAYTYIDLFIFRKKMS